MEGSSKIKDGCKNCKELEKKVAELELQRRIYSSELEAELKKKSVSDSISAKEELKLLERYKSMYLTSSDAISIIEPPDWKYTSGNPASWKLFGAKDEKEFISFTPYDLSPETQPDGRNSTEKAKEMIETALKNGSHFFQWTHKKYKGEDFPATVLLTKMTIDGKDILQTTVRDISDDIEQKNKLKEKAEETEKLNKLMVGRELKMVELKQEINRLKHRGINHEELNSSPYLDGITLEEKVIQDLAHEYTEMINNSNIDDNIKSSINNKINTLKHDSEGHEYKLKELSNESR